MTGTYDRGSVVFDRVVPTAALRTGDVITFAPPAHAGPGDAPHPLGAHRRRQARLHHQGRLQPARRPLGRAHARRRTQARVAFHVPYVGFGIAALSFRQVRMLLIGLPALLIALATLAGMWKQAGLEARALRSS